MRVRRGIINIPQPVRLDDLHNVEGIGFDFEQYMSFEFLTSTFQYISPGEERLFVILRADNYTYEEIGWMAGKKGDYVERVIAKVRNKLRNAGITPHLTKAK